MSRHLKESFYKKDAFSLAQDLLGKYLVRVYRGKRLTGKIVETEAYLGEKDKAAHSFGGKRTNRNKILYSPGGKIYIYLVYGMYWQLNITAGKEDQPECVLIRALETNDDIKFTNGPGKLCRYLRLTKSFYGEDLSRSRRIWLEDRHYLIKHQDIISTSRIGIAYAQDWKDKPLRFYLRNSPFVSKFRE